MKATGIVRRIDDLGRIVIPKEIRRTQRIRESDPMEIYTSHSGAIMLKKYPTTGELGEFAQDYAYSVSQATGHRVIITDREAVIAAAGPQSRQELGKALTKKQLSNLDDRLFGSDNETAFATIISNGDAVGLVIMDKNPQEEKSWNQEAALEIVRTACFFFGKIME